MKKILWRIIMTYWILRYYTRWYQVIKAWVFSGDSCWIDYYDFGHTPKEAVIEDMSYAQ